MYQADLVITNGRVLTMDSNKPEATCVAIKDKRIVYVGDNADTYIAKGTKIIDAKGRIVMPGLIDGHAHPLSMPAFDGIALDQSMNLDTVLSTIKDYVENHPERDSYFGLVYDETCTGDRYNKETLDSVCPDKPLMLLGVTCHEGWANSKAFEVAGITKDTPDPLPGKMYFVRRDDGEPQGVIKDVAPFAMVVDACKPCKVEDYEGGLIDFIAAHNALGITASADSGILTPANESDVLNIIEKLVSEDKLNCRFSGSTVFTGMGTVQDTIETLKKYSERFNNDIIRLKTFKLLQDGCYEARTSSCYEPYLDTDFMADPMLFGDELKDAFLKVSSAGFDIHVHCLGDRAMHETIEATCFVRDSGIDDNLITIAHNHSIPPEDIPKYAEYSIIANFTSQWCVNKPDIINGIGQQRHDDMIRIKSVMDTGAVVTLGSDCPSDELGYEPWKGIEMAITRRTYGHPEEEMMGHPEECLSLMDALKAYTINSAIGLGLDDITGSLEAGKYADLIILDRNIFDIDTYEIHKVRPAMTIFGGKIVYEA